MEPEHELYHIRSIREADSQFHASLLPRLRFEQRIVYGSASIQHYLQHSANRGDRRYIAISESIGRMPLIGSVGLIPAAKDSRMPSGEWVSNAPNRSASMDTVPLPSMVPSVEVVAETRRFRVRLNGADHQWGKDPP